MLVSLAAAAADDGQPAARLDNIVVTASRSSTTLDDMPLHTTVITAKDIQASPAQTLDQLLRNVPGLLVPGAPAYTTDPTGANIKFRGMDKKVLVLVDGVPVLDPFYSTIQWFKVPLSSIARVEVVRGGGSSLWGNLAVGGVINIVSKRPNANDGEASISRGSMNTWSAALSKNFVFSDGLRLNLSVDHFETDGYDTSPEDLRARFWPGRGNSSARATNLRLGAFFNPTEDLNGFLRIGYHEQNEDIGGYAFGSNLQRSPDLQAGITKALNENSSVSANVYAQRVHFDKFNGAGCYAGTSFACGASVPGSGASASQQMSPTLQYASSYDLNTYRERGASVVYSHTWTGLVEELQWGVDYRGISGEDAQQSYRTPTPALPDALRLQRTNDGRGDQAFTGVFSQLKLHPVAPLEVTIGARFDRFGSSDGSAVQTNFSNVASPVATASMGGPVPSLAKTAFDPSLSMRYEVDARLALRGSVYKAFRAPGLNNLYRSFGSSSITIANPLLGPETLTAKEIGADWRAQDYSLGATLFQADVSNVVATYAITPGASIPAAVQNICGADYTGSANAACPGTVSFYTNGQDQRSTGIELDAKWSASRDLSLSAYATGTRTYYTRASTGDPIRVQLPLVPKVVAGASATWQAGRRWTHFIDLRYNSAMTLSNLTLAPRIRQGGYTVVNLSTQFKVDARFEIFASLVNAFGKRYTDSSANNPQSVGEAMPRAATIGLRAHF
jgi:iron complex outermembrane receptor protein